MPFDIDPVYVFYAVRGAGRGPVRRRRSICCSSTRASYRKNVNRRLRLMENQPDRESVLVSCGASAA